MQYKNFNDVGKKLKRAIEKSQKEALNKALGNVNARYVKDVGKETGISAKDLRKRVKIIKATTSVLGGVLSIGVRVHFNLSYFKPMAKKVMSRRGARKGVTVKIGNDSRSLVPGGFIVSGLNSGKKLVMTRVGNARYPIKLKYTEVFIEAIEKLKPAWNKYAEEMYKKRFIEQLKYNLYKD